MKQNSFMAMWCAFMWVPLALPVVVLAQPVRPSIPTPAEAPPDRFETVNNVRLQYLDWGGTGETLLFLTSLGGTAKDSNPLAIQFTENFRVLGLTRRGQGLSEKPETGYDIATLTKDVVSFLDAMSIRRVTLIGYSLAGNELTEMAGKYPSRVSKLVYLDAAYDLAENAELARNAHLDLPSLPGADQPTLQLLARSNEYHPDYSRIKAPALAFFVTYDSPPASPMWDEATKEKLLAFWISHGKAYRRDQIEKFQRGVKDARVVELHNTTHGGFVFEDQQRGIVIREMQKFLLGSDAQQG